MLWWFLDLKKSQQLALCLYLQAPNNPNCASITSYNIRYPETTSDVQTVTSTNMEVYADGNVEIKFTISAVNNASLESTTISETATTPTISKLRRYLFLLH